MPTVLNYWNEMTPYRLHIMQRLAREVPDVRIVHVFSHSVTRNSMPWQVAVPGHLEVIHFPQVALRLDTYVHPRTWRLSRLVARSMDDIRPDLLILHGHGDASRWLVAVAARSRKIPVLHASDANALEIPMGPGIVSTLRFAFLRAALSLADGYMPMGLGGRLYYGLFGGAGKPMFYFPYEPDPRMGEVTPTDCMSFARRAGLDPGRNHFLYSGRLVREKGVDLIIRAFERVAGDRPGWDLAIAGTGPLEARLKAAVPASLSHRIRFLGFLQMDDLAAAYNLCDALVHASSYEPWGLVIHEAVAAGMAVVASDTAGAAVELVRHRVNGMRCRPGSVEGLAAALLEVSCPSNLASMKAQSRDVIREWRQGFDPVRGFRDAVSHYCPQPARNGQSRQ